MSDPGAGGLQRAVEVHYVCSDAVPQDEDTRARLSDLLSEEERARHARFRFARDRHVYLAAHALLRSVLAERLGVAPQALRFEVGSHGKPALAADGPAAAPALHFNLSHTHGLVACALSAGCPVGVDAERIDRRADIDQLSERVLSPAERSELTAHLGPARRLRFFQYWTLKEAYIKAVGRGLSLPLDQVSFEIPDAGPVRVGFGPDIDDRAEGWQLSLGRPLGTHVLALAVRPEVVNGTTGNVPIRFIRQDDPDATLRSQEI